MLELLSLPTLIPNLLLGLYKLHNEEKYLKAAAGVAASGYIAFVATLGIAGGSVLAYSKQSGLAFASGFFSACVVSAASSYKTLQNQGVLKDLKVFIPAEEAKILEGTDVTQPPKGN